MQAAESNSSLGATGEVTPEEVPFEFLMNGLRLREGFEISHFIARTGLELAALEPTLTGLMNERLLERTPTHIRCSEHGFNFLDTILQRFLTSPC